MAAMFQSFTWASGTFVCSNHFPLGRTPENRKTDYPSIFITLSDYLQKKSPKKGKTNKLQEAGSSRCLSSSIEVCDDDSEENDEELETSTDFSESVPMQFEQLTKELEVKVTQVCPRLKYSSFYSII